MEAAKQFSDSVGRNGQQEPKTDALVLVRSLRFCSFDSREVTRSTLDIWRDIYTHCTYLIKNFCSKYRKNSYTRKWTSHLGKHCMGRHGKGKKT